MRNMRLCLIIALILSSICGTCYADYTLGQPVPLDTGAIVAGSTGWFQSNPVITSSGSIYLAVWVDMRDAGRGSDLYATRIAADGTVLDPLGIRLTTHASVTGKPDVCWNGQNFFVVYANNTGVVGTEILGLRVSPDGVIVDEAPAVICDTGTARKPCVSWDGENHVVVYEDTVENCIWVPCKLIDVIMARRVSAGGVPVGTEPTGVAAGSDPDVASSPDGDTLVVWSQPDVAGTSSDVYGAILDYAPGAQMVPIPISATANAEDMPDVCWAGGQFMVVWQDGDQSRSIRGRRIGTDGGLLDPAVLNISSVTEKQSDAQVAWNGTNSLVTWTRKGSAAGQLDIYAGRVYSDGTLLDGSGFPVCTADDRQIKPCVGSLGVNFLVCWMDSRSDVGPTVPNLGFQVRGRRIYSTGILAGEEFPLTQSAPQHKISCSAYNGRQFLVCFDEWRDGARNLYGELIDAYTGEPVTSEPFVISPLLIENPFPSAAWNGESFVVTWLGGADLYPGSGVIAHKKVMAARVTPTGTVLDSEGIIVYDGVTSPIYVQPAIASDGNRCLVVLRMGSNVNGKLLSRDGTVSSSIVIGASKSNAVHEGVAVCWTGQSYFIAWKQAYSTSGGVLVKGGIDYKTVNADGGGLSILKRITDETYPDYFRLACNGQNVLLAAYGPQIVTRRFSLAGNLLDTTPLIIPQSAGADCVNVAWNGADYILTWLSGKEDAASAQSWQDDMMAARVSYFNQLVDIVPISVTDTPLSELGGSMCAGPPSRAFLAYSNSDGPPYQSTRAKGLFLDAWLTVSSVGQIGQLYEGAHVNVPGEVVTALWPRYYRDSDGRPRLYDYFYIQEGRSFGIGVKSPRSEGSPVPGNAVSFSGRLRRLDGEVTIESSDVNIISTSNPLPDPIGMICRNLGGVAASPYFNTIENLSGLYNTGLRVRVIGKVTNVGGDHFFLDDGVGTMDNEWTPGVMVFADPQNLPAEGSFIKVTGISSRYMYGTVGVHRIIRATGWSAIDSAPE